MGYVDVAHYSLLTKIRCEGMTKGLEWLIPSLFFAHWKNYVVPLDNSYFPFISLSELFLLTEAVPVLAQRIFRATLQEKHPNLQFWFVFF